MVEYTHTTKLFSFSLLRVRKKNGCRQGGYFFVQNQKSQNHMVSISKSNLSCEIERD